MKKNILITGATDGIGLATAKILASKGHMLLLHGRNPDKLKNVKELISTLTHELANEANVQTYLADLSTLSEVHALVKQIKAKHDYIDVLINNAGVFKVAEPITPDGLDVRFAVNTLAPFLLTQQLAPILGKHGRVINLSSAAQAPVDIDALQGQKQLTDMEAYAQSKLAITLWTQILAERYKNMGPAIVSVNPGSLLASKMVQQGFGISGNDITIGAKILVKMALDEELGKHSGQYFDNDKGLFTAPHPDGKSSQKSAEIIKVIEAIIGRF